MPWGNDHRRASELPKNWQEIRAKVFKDASYRCEWQLSDGRRCEEVATDCDHIGDRHDHSPSNLRALCGPHHDMRTAWQGIEAKRAKRAAAKLPPEGHPGYLR